eukprot:923538-Pelagomonas_calceolata.AAC.2
MRNVSRFGLCENCLMLVEKVSPAADQPESRAVGQSLKILEHCLKVESCEWVGGSKISVSVLKSKRRNMLSFIVIAMKCVSCAENTRIF